MPFAKWLEGKGSADPGVAPARDWYATEAARGGWSRDVLLNHIMNQTHVRVGAAPSNFTNTLPAPESDLARQLAKDPYVFDFLAQSRPAHERDLEQALMDRLKHTLLELGLGFAFVGRQVHFEVDGDDFYLDLLFFHVEQLRYVVIELKIGKFTPRDAGQLGFYVALVDDRLRQTDPHASTVGILLCASKNDGVVEYALRGTNPAGRGRPIHLRLLAGRDAHATSLARRSARRNRRHPRGAVDPNPCCGFGQPAAQMGGKAVGARGAGWIRSESL